MINFIHFLTGSQLYGMTNPQSDYDYLVINNSDNPYPHPENKEVEVWSRDLFMVKLVDHDLKALEDDMKATNETIASFCRELNISTPF